MRIAHLSAEVSPFAKTGGLGDVVGALPKTLAELGHDVSVWMPYYRQARETLAKRGTLPELVLPWFRIDLGYHAWDVGLLKTVLPGSQVPVYLVAIDALFDRSSIYASGPWGDDGIVRYSVF